MKKIILTLLSFFAIFILSGCSSESNPGQITDNNAEVFKKGSVSGSLWKTKDGGHTFQSKSRIDEKTIITKANILSIAHHPRKEGMIYVSSVESGIFKTEDGGEKWQLVDFPPKKVYSFILDKNSPDNNMFASGVIGSWGKIFYTSDGGKKWEDVYTEPGQETIVTALSQHPKETNIIFAGTSSGTVVKSYDIGKTWKNVGSKVDGIVFDFAFDSDKNPITYLLAYGNKLYYSDNGGERWLDWEEEKRKEVDELYKKASEVSSSGNTSAAQSFQKKAEKLNDRNQYNKMPSGIISVSSDPLVSGTVYVGTRSGFFRSTDYGKYWYELNIIESAKGFPIRSIAVNPKNPKEIVFVAGKAFYKSTDSGTTWAVTGLNIDRDVSFVSYDPFDPNSLFVGLRKFQ